MTRSDLVDRILSISALISAIAAVGVAVYEARIDRAHQKVSVWPYVDQFNSLPPGEAYTRNVANVGIGPALVRSIQVQVDDRPVRTWTEAIRALTGGSGRDLIYTTLRSGSVILPGNTVTLLRLPPGDEAFRFWSEAQSGRLVIRVCYCSLYDDCWRSDSREPSPEPVGSCPADPDREFRQ